MVHASRLVTWIRVRADQTLFVVFCRFHDCSEAGAGKDGDHGAWRKGCVGTQREAVDWTLAQHLGQLSWRRTSLSRCTP